MMCLLMFSKIIQSFIFRSAKAQNQTMGDHSTLAKSLSAASFSSDMLDAEDLVDDIEVDEAPYDIMGEVPGSGNVLIGKKGSALPMTTKYYKNKEGTKAFKFEISRLLKVTIAAEREIGKKAQVKDVIATESGRSINELNGSGVDASSGSNINRENIDVSRSQSTSSSGSNPLNALFDTFEEEEQVQEKQAIMVGKRFRSLGEFLADVDENFVDIVIGGLEFGLRKAVEEKLQARKDLSPKENMAIIHSLNQVVFEEFGSERPDPKMCQKLSDILKDKFPQTYRVKMTVQTSFGSLEMKKSKGEGGHSDLSKRIGDNFYNKFTKKDLKRPLAGGESLENLAGIAGSPKSKKHKKMYGVSPEKYNFGVMASKAEKEQAKAAFMTILDAGSLTEKTHAAIAARVFTQNQLRSLQPSQAAGDLKPIWYGGPALLSEHFEWLVSGARDGNLAVSADRQMKKVLNLVEQFIISKKGPDFEAEIRGVKVTTELHYGNDTWFRVYLIRQLAKLFKNEAGKLLFVDGCDDINEGPSEQEPNVFVTKKNTFGEDEYEERVELSLRIGTKVIMEELSLSQALSGCIQLYFLFHLNYPGDADDLYQFTQRIFCNFRDHDGARNKRNAVKKCFREFEVWLTQYIYENLICSFSFL